MRKLIFVILLAVLLPFAAAAQNRERRGQGYVFVAPGTTSEGGSTLHIGVGGEGLRLELRDHILRDYRSLHIVGFRIGLAFR